MAAALERALAEADLAGFYAVLRGTDLPILAAALAGDPGGLARAGCEVVHRLGAISPAVALAFENHLYVTAALATVPVADNPWLERRRRALLDAVVGERLLVANTNARIHSDTLGAIGVTTRREGDGFRVDGAAAYLSLATEGDLIIFLTGLEGEGPALFVAPLKGNPEIEIGPFLFPRAMLDSDTRRVVFRNAFLDAESLLLSGRDAQLEMVSLFQLSWHQMLIAALYLGAAAGALEEARRFLRSTRGWDGRPLAELDGMVVDVGRLAIQYRAGCALVRETGRALGALAAGELPVADARTVFEQASAAKHFGTRCAEDVVREARRIVGARAFTGGNALERLSQEVIFGTLGPEVNAFIEREHGQQSLGETAFTARPW